MKRLLLIFFSIVALTTTIYAQTNLTTDGTKATASNSEGPNGVEAVFDADTSTGWLVTTWPQAIMYDFETPIVVDGYALHPLVKNVVDAHDGMQPSDWTFQGSADASAWDDLDVIAGDPVSDTWEEFSISNSTAYQYYRILLTGAGDDTMALGEMQMYVTEAPTVETGDVTYLETQLASVPGEVVSDGGATVSSRGVCYSKTIATPTLLDNYRTTAGEEGSFSISVNNLDPGTMYYYRTFATNSKGTTYGTVKTFTTLTSEQTITFGALAPVAYGDANFTLTASASSGLPVSYASSNPAVASVSGNTVTINGAGTTTITASQSGDGTYDPATPVDQVLTVTKANLTYTAEDKTKVYGEALPELTYLVTGFVGTDDESDLTTIPAPEVEAGAAAEVGIHSISFSAGADENYSFTYEPADLTVTKASLTATAEKATKTYGEENPSLTYTISGFVLDDDETSVDVLPEIATDATLESTVGYYPITLSGASDANYDFEYEQDTLHIEPAVLTVSSDDASKTYGEANPELTFTFSGFVLGESASVVDAEPTISTTANALSDVGEYAINLNGGQDDNYSLSLESTGVLTISKAELTVTVQDASRDEGVANPEFTLEYTGFLNDDDVSDLNTPPTAATEANAESAPGEYAIVASGGADNNYEFIYIDGTLTVNEVVSVFSNTVNNITLFPNPVMNELNFNLDGENISSVKIITTNGSVVRDEQFVSQSLDVNGLDSGVYVLILTTDSGMTYTKQFSKQ